MIGECPFRPICTSVRFKFSLESSVLARTQGGRLFNILR